MLSLSFFSIGVYSCPRTSHLNGNKASQQGKIMLTDFKVQQKYILTLSNHLSFLFCFGGFLASCRMTWINSPKASTVSPVKIQHLECILTQRAKKPSSQAWASCIQKSTLRQPFKSIVYIVYFYHKISLSDFKIFRDNPNTTV